jgi:hypothetical protein
MHPGSNEYSMPNRRVVNKFLDEVSRSLVELFDRENSFFPNLSLNRLLDLGCSPY